MRRVRCALVPPDENARYACGGDAIVARRRALIGGSRDNVLYPNFGASVTRPRLAVGSAVLAVAFFMTPTLGQAAVFTKFSYTVTGGTFDVTNKPLAAATGAITSGSVAFKAISPAGAATPHTNTGFNTGPVEWALSKLTLSGPSGYFKFLNVVNVFNFITFIDPSSRSWAASGVAAGKSFTPLFSVGGTGTGAVSVFLHWDAFGGDGVVLFAGATAAIAHEFILGSEVQTIVPEPGSGMLLAFGVTGLATAVRLRRKRS